MREIYARLARFGTPVLRMIVAFTAVVVARETAQSSSLVQIASPRPEQIAALRQEVLSLASPRLPTRPLYRMPRLPNGRLQLPDGQTIPAPDDSGREALGSSPQVQSFGWSGYIPPSSDSSGPFRRAYSYPSLAYLNFYDVYTPLSANLLSGDDGYIYVEGWQGPNASNVEGGIFLNLGQRNYSMYIHGPGGYYGGTTRFPPGDDMGIILETGASGWPCSVSCANAYVADFTRGTSDWGSISAAGWTGNCCIFAHMTTIAQTGGNNFRDGSLFGPVNIVDSFQGTEVQGVHHPVPFVPAGFQSWPNNSSCVSVRYKNQDAESDTINLNPAFGC